MPSRRHEALVEILRAAPRLVPALACRALGLLPPRRATVADAGFSQLVPPQRSADLVVTAGPGAPWRGLVVEVQLARVARKRLVWPLYAAALRARLGGPVLLVVVAPDPRVAAWARQPIELGQPDSAFVPVVIGPEAIPRITSVREAARHPGLAMLSVFAHGNERGGERVAFALERAARRLDARRTVRYSDLIMAALAKATRRKLEALMQSSGYPYSDYYRKHYVRGLKQGEARGKAQGEARGKAQGEARGKAESVLAFLQARGLRVPAADRSRLLGCDDQATLDAWIAAAATATSVAEVLAAKPRRRRATAPRLRRRARSAGARTPRTRRAP